MIITFTPTAGLFNPAQNSSVPAVLVNGEAITELEIARVERQNSLYSRVAEGQAAEDLQLLLLASLIDNEVLRQAAASTRVSGGEVREAVDAFREQNGVAGSANNQRYRNLINNAGFTDATFRDYIRAQLKQEQYLEEVIGEVDISDAELESFYQANRNAYLNEPRIKARQIVVEDEALAFDLYARLLAGEDFAALASEHSAELAEGAGALGAAEGSREPQPVGPAALPSAVANAAFSLQGAGLTEVVESGGRYYIVQVTDYIPAEPQPLEEVTEQVREDALAAKRRGLIEEKLAELREQATISIPKGSSYSFENPVVARVGETEIRAAELARSTYLNPQIQQFLTPDSASLITDFFKPTILNQLIEQELAAQGAQTLEAEFVGPDAQVAQSALIFVSRNAEATDEAVQEYYESNQDRFTVPAKAVVTRANFDSAEAAAAFREAVLVEGTADLEALATESGGEVEKLGIVNPGELASELDTALFETDAFTEISETSGWTLSDVLVISEPIPESEADAGEADAPTEEEEVASEGEAEGAATDEATAETAPSEPQTRDSYVVLTASRRPEQVRPLEEVRAQVEDAVLLSSRAELSETWLEGLREDITVENLLETTAPAEPEPAADEAAPTEETAPADAAAPADETETAPPEDDSSAPTEEAAPATPDEGETPPPAEEADSLAPTATEETAPATDEASDAAPPAENGEESQ